MSGISSTFEAILFYLLALNLLLRIYPIHRMFLSLSTPLRSWQVGCSCTFCIVTLVSGLDTLIPRVDLCN